jgi:hypothetical protein
MRWLLLGWLLLRWVLLRWVLLRWVLLRWLPCAGFHALGLPPRWHRHARLGTRCGQPRLIRTQVRQTPQPRAL